MIENVKTEMINIFLEKLILLDKINKPKIEYLKGYMDDKLVCDLSSPWISQCTVWNFHTTIWNPSTIKIKNLKIKPQ